MDKEQAGEIDEIKLLKVVMQSVRAHCQHPGKQYIAQNGYYITDLGLATTPTVEKRNRNRILRRNNFSASHNPHNECT
jgi:hypothetical protein